MTAEPRQLVLGTATGERMQAHHIRAFTESLRATGYRGDIAMVVELFDRRMAKLLRGCGASPLRYLFVEPLHGKIESHRFHIYGRYLAKHAAKYDQVLLADVRDVIFQRDPFEGLAKTGCHAFLEDRRLTVDRDPYQEKWHRAFLKPEQFEELRHVCPVCVGVVIGATEAMRDYCERMTTHIRSLPRKLRGEVGSDTVFHHLMIYKTREVDFTIHPNGPHTIHLAAAPASETYLDSENRIRTQDGDLPAIVHQFDRIPAYSAMARARYGNPGQADW